MYVLRGDAWRDKGDFDKAMADFNESLRLDPNDSLAYHRRGYAWQSMGDFDKAIADHSEAIRLDPKNANSLRRSSHRPALEGGPRPGDRRFQRGDSTRSEVRSSVRKPGRGAGGSKRNFDQALADCDEAIRLDPKESLGYDGRAWIWATCSDERYRDGRRAVESATRGCELTDWKRAAQSRHAGRGLR